MAADIQGYRIFILGAGFSRPAGLPLAAELFAEVKGRIGRQHGRNTKFQRDLDSYVDYRVACGASGFTEANIDLEELMSFLDIEHYLGLRGSDTWSREGNESQLMIRMAIGGVIQGRTPSADKLPEAYYRFAEQFKPHDTVITLNYDIVLERALEHVGKRYRLFPRRLKSVGYMLDEVDESFEEVTVLKLHGSVDWFDNRSFLAQREALERTGSTKPPIHSVFADPQRFGAQRMLEGPHHQTDPFLHIFRIKHVDEYYQRDRGFNPPFILSPSHVKFVYVEPLLDFWRGLGQAGGWNLGVSVIGFSMPQHDEHIRIVLYQMVSNYQGFSWDDKLVGIHKDVVRFVDLQSGREAEETYKKRYGFSDPLKSDYYFKGFDLEVVDFLFNRFRHPPEKAAS